MVTRPFDLTRTTPAVLSIVGLIVVSFLVVRPFLAATVWAATLVVATWPFMRRLQSTFGGRRWAAVTLMTLLLLFLVLIPLSMAISSIATHASRLMDLPDAAVAAAHLPPPPTWLSDVPLVGRPVAEKWKRLVESSAEDMVQLVRPYAKSVTEWFIAAAGTFGGTVLHLFLTIGIAAILYAKGEMAADWCRLFGRRLADERGEEVVDLAGGAIRGVAFGVILTALAQTFATGIALTAAGVPQGRFPDCHYPGSVPGADRPYPRGSAGHHLAVRDGPDHVGHHPRRHRRSRRADGQLPAARPDQAWSRSAAVVDHTWRHWRPSRLRGTRPVLGPGDPRRYVHVAAALGCRSKRLGIAADVSIRCNANAPSPKDKSHN